DGLSPIRLSGVHQFPVLAIGPAGFPNPAARFDPFFASSHGGQYLDVGASSRMGPSSHVARGDHHADPGHVSAAGSLLRLAAWAVRGIFLVRRGACDLS